MKRLLSRARLGDAQRYAVVAGAICLASAAAPAQSRAPLVPSSATWAERVAVGMRSGDQIGPFSVEAQRDGWVIVNMLPLRPDAGEDAPTMRLIAKTADVKRWVRQARAFARAPRDSITGPNGIPSLTLGSRYRIQLFRPPDGGPDIYFSVGTCGPSSSTATTHLEELDGFLTVLDSAVIAAGARSRPPNRARPYYASEVSCPPWPADDNPIVEYPDAVPALLRTHAVIGVRFVVDTLGNVEPHSVDFLPGTDALHARIARATIERWHFRPAEWGGTAVRQIVQRAITFESTSPPRDTTDEIEVSAGADGWVHFRSRSTLPMLAAQEWFVPDSVFAWAKRIDSISPSHASSDTTSSDRSASLGLPTGIQYTAIVAAKGARIVRVGSIAGCGGAGSWSAPPVDATLLKAFRAAARDARARRRTPANAAATVHDSDDVACTAWLPWHLSTLSHARRVWEYPTGLYSETMARTRAHADVFFSVVVDTTGAANLATLQVMPGADPRAMRALRETLGEVRFRPATRGGERVPQRVYQSIRFEPPPTCANVGAGPACARLLAPSSQSAPPHPASPQ